MSLPAKLDLGVDMALSAKDSNPTQTGTRMDNTPTGTTPPTQTTSHSSPMAIWQSFTHHRRNLQVQKTTVYEDKQAKSEAQHRRHEFTFVRSNEENSAAFDLAGINDVSPEDFFGALVHQHPNAIGWVPSKHSASCVIVSFEDSSSRDAAVHAGVSVKNLMVPGVPTVGLENSVYQVALDGLPLMNREVLATALRETMGRYGHILDIKLCTDKFHLLTGRGSVLLDISAEGGEDAYLALEHEVHLEVKGTKRIILARWRGMAIHCNYCKKEGHKIADCQKLKERKERMNVRKLCFICQSPDHLKADCPRSQQPSLGAKRPRMADAFENIHVSDTNTKEKQPTQAPFEKVSKQPPETPSDAAPKRHMASQNHRPGDTAEDPCILSDSDESITEAEKVINIHTVKREPEDVAMETDRGGSDTASGLSQY